MSVQTNGLQGGDSGHGGFAEIGLSGGDGAIRLLASDSSDAIAKLRAGGDDELLALAAALEWAGHRLRQMLGPVEAPSATEPSSGQEGPHTARVESSR